MSIHAVPAFPPLQREIAALRRRATLMARWLSADARRVTRFTPTGSEQQPGAPYTETSIEAALRGFARDISRVRFMALIRRWLLVLITAALVLALIRLLFTALPAWAALAIPLVPTVAMLIRLARQPELETVARLLDNRFELREVVASAFEVAGASAAQPRSPLVPQLESRAKRALGDIHGQWRVRQAPALREWLLLPVLGAVLLLALLVHLPNTPAAPAGTTAALPGAVVAQIPSEPLPSAPPAGTRLQQVKLSIAVLQSNAAAPTPHAVAAHARVSPSARQRAQGTAAAPANPSGASGSTSASQHVGPVSGATARPGASAAPGTGAAALPVSTAVPLPVITNRRLFVPTKQSPNGQGVASGRTGTGKPSTSTSSSGNSASVSTRSLDSHGAAQTRRGANGQAGQRGGVGGAGTKIGAVGKGASAVPYGGNLSALGNGPAKPGLITGDTPFTGKGTKGSTAGRGAGSALTSNKGNQQLPSSGGKQVQLTSPYGASNLRQGTGSVPGKNNPTSGGTLSLDGGASSGAGASDYIPPDGHRVEFGDQSVVARYFTPGSSE